MNFHFQLKTTIIYKKGNNNNNQKIFIKRITYYYYYYYYEFENINKQHFSLISILSKFEELKIRKRENMHILQKNKKERKYADFTEE